MCNRFLEMGVSEKGGVDFIGLGFLFCEILFCDLFGCVGLGMFLAWCLHLWLVALGVFW